MESKLHLDVEKLDPYYWISVGFLFWPNGWEFRLRTTYFERGGCQKEIFVGFISKMDSRSGDVDNFLCLGCFYLSVSIWLRYSFVWEVESSYQWNSIRRSRLAGNSKFILEHFANWLQDTCFSKYPVAAGSIFLLFSGPILLIAFLATAYLIISGKEEIHEYVICHNVFGCSHYCHHILSTNMLIRSLHHS